MVENVADMEPLLPLVRTTVIVAAPGNDSMVNRPAMRLLGLPGRTVSGTELAAALETLRRRALNAEEIDRYVRAVLAACPETPLKQYD